MRALAKFLEKYGGKVSSGIADAMSTARAGGEMAMDAAKYAKKKYPVASGAILGGLGAYAGEEALQDDDEIHKQKLRHILRMLQDEGEI